MYWGHHFWGMHVFWWAFWMILVFVLLFYAWPTQIRRRDSAIEELRRAYASGQISEEEYRHRLAVLREHREPPSHREPPPQTGSAA